MFGLHMCVSTMYMPCAYVCAHHVRAWCQGRSEEDTRLPDCELPYGSWEWSSDP